MNILMITNEFPPSIGGVQTHVFELSKAMIDLGHSVYVITRLRDSKWLPEEIVAGINVHRIRLPNNHLVYDFLLKRQIRKCVLKNNIDLIHVHGMRPLMACKNLDAPVVFTNHTSSFLKRSSQGGAVCLKMRKQLEGVDSVFAPSIELAERTKDTGYNGPVHFISNGVDIKKFSPGPTSLREKLGIPECAFVAVLARRLEEKNGVLFFARAMEHLHDQNLHILVAGGGSERSEFEKIIHSFPSSERVHMLGPVANDKMPAVYRACDVSVLPSLMEATSIAGLEAMASGLAIVGTNVGGIPAIVADGGNGILVEPKSSLALANAIKQLLNDPERTKEMGIESLNRATNEFSWVKIAEKFLSYYPTKP